MNTLCFARRLTLASALVACAASAGAQVLPPDAKGTKRPPAATTTGTGGIPTGQDTGTPATSGGAQLGITTIPRNDEERRGVKTESAAARAAARKRGPGLAAVEAAAASGAASGVVGAAPASAPLPPQPGALNPSRSAASGVPARAPKR